MPTKKTTKSPTKSKRSAKKSKAFVPKLKRHPENPFRMNSSYGVCFDALAAHPEGIKRQDHVELVAALTTKDPVRAKYDCAVLLSVSEDGRGHKSSSRMANQGWYVHKECSLVTLKRRKGKRS